MLGHEERDVLGGTRSGQIAQEFDDRRERGRAAALEAQVERPRVDAGAEFGCKAGLADARGADHGHELRRCRGPGVVECRPQCVQFVAAPHERGGVLHRATVVVDDLERGKRVGLALHPHLAEHLVRHR